MKINVVGTLEKIYSKFPNLNPELKNYIARLLPPISMVFGLLITLSSVLELIGTPVVSLFSVKSSGLPVLQILLLTNAIGVFQGLLMIFAYGPLKKRQEKGWRFMVWSQVLWLITSVLSLSSSAVIALVLFYPLIQAKSEYK